MAAQAGNKTTKCPETQIQPSECFFHFVKNQGEWKKKIKNLSGNRVRAFRHLRPPGCHSKEFAKTISLQSAAILIWQPDSITRRKNCFSRHQRSSGNYLNCVMIMPQSSGENSTATSAPPKTLQHRRSSSGEIKFRFHSLTNTRVLDPYG